MLKKIKFFGKKLKFRIFTHPPILVWQMGKVGSSSVYRSLNHLDLTNPIFHIHFLNPDNLNRIKNEFEVKGLSLPSHIDKSEILLEQYKKTGGTGWKIITIVRELPNIIISGFFQNIQRWSYDHKGLLSEHAEINTDLAHNLLKKYFSNFNESTDYVCSWFDREIRQMLQIDVFSHPFDHEKGYTIIKENNIDLLILKTELLNSTFSEAVATFLNIDRPVPLINTNISGEKHYRQAIKQVRDEMVIPDDVLIKINSSKYMKHFYPSKTL